MGPRSWLAGQTPLHLLPRGEIYYAPESRLWFWLDGDDWRSGVRLPLEFQTYIRTGGVDIELDNDQPYVEHRYVIEHYGGESPLMIVVTIGTTTIVADGTDMTAITMMAVDAHGVRAD